MDEVRAGRLMRDCVRLLTQIQRTEVAVCCDTTSTESHILSVLENEALTLAELVKRLNIDKGWTSRTVESMVQAGLLAKSPNPVDKRSVIISLTPTGQEKAAEVYQTVHTQDARVFSRIPPTERATVFRALELLHHALQEEQAGTPILITLEEETR